MLLANLAKSPAIERLIGLERSPVPELSPSTRSIAQLIELFNKGANGGWNKDASYDYLSYVFADLAKVRRWSWVLAYDVTGETNPVCLQFPSFVTYLTTPTPNSPLDPLTIFLPHTMHASPVRRLGTASLLKNIALIHPDILYLLQPAHSVLPPLLLPLCSSNQEGLSEDEIESLPEECQFLGEEHRQERDMEILKTHLETLWLLATRGGVEGRRIVKERGTYPVIRELHLQIEDEGLRRGCERLVDVLMGDEIASLSKGAANGGDVIEMGNAAAEGNMITQTPAEDEDEDEDEDNAIVPIF